MFTVLNANRYVTASLEKELQERQQEHLHKLQMLEQEMQMARQQAKLRQMEMELAQQPPPPQPQPVVGNLPGNSRRSPNVYVMSADFKSTSGQRILFTWLGLHVIYGNGTAFNSVPDCI